MQFSTNRRAFPAPLSHFNYNATQEQGTAALINQKICQYKHTSTYIHYPMDLYSVHFTQLNLI